MFSVRTVLVLFLFGLIAIVASVNGEPGCDTSSSWEQMHDEQAQRSSDNADKFNRLTLDCETTTSGSSGHGNSGFVTILDLSVGLFFLIGLAIGIWFFCVRRQKALNAATIKPYPGEVGGKEMGYVMDEKTKTVAMGAPTGKLSNGDTNV